MKRVAERGKEIGLLLPQIISVDEVRKVKEILKEINFTKAKVGVMVETPAAVQIIKDLCDEKIDFISFGTNDLTQYILAVDRGNEQVQHLFNETHPAVLYQIEFVIRVCKRMGVETSICGQAGSRKEMVKFLVERGIDSITVNADVAKEISDYVAELEGGKTEEVTIAKSVEEVEEAVEKKEKEEPPKPKPEATPQKASEEKPTETKPEAEVPAEEAVEEAPAEKVPEETKEEKTEPVHEEVKKEEPEAEVKPEPAEEKKEEVQTEEKTEQEAEAPKEESKESNSEEKPVEKTEEASEEKAEEFEEQLEEADEGKPKEQETKPVVEEVEEKPSIEEIEHEEAPKEEILTEESTPEERYKAMEEEKHEAETEEPKEEKSENSNQDENLLIETGNEEKQEDKKELDIF